MSWIARCNGQSVFGNACNTVASLTKNFLAFAELLQTPKRRKWSLQDSCKCPKGKNGACRTSAKTKKEKSELAELLQRPKRRNRSLQNFCKRPKEKNGACRNAASAPKNFLAFAATLQVPRKTFWRLQERCKCFQKRFDPRVTSVEALCLHRTHVDRKRDPLWGTFVCLIVSWSPKRIAEWASTDN